MAGRTSGVVDPYYVSAATLTPDSRLPVVNRDRLRPLIPVEWWQGVPAGALRTPANTPLIPTPGNTPAPGSGAPGGSSSGVCDGCG